MASVAAAALPVASLAGWAIGHAGKFDALQSAIPCRRCRGCSQLGASPLPLRAAALESRVAAHALRESSVAHLTARLGSRKGDEDHVAAAGARRHVSSSNKLSRF